MKTLLSFLLMAAVLHMMIYWRFPALEPWVIYLAWIPAALLALLLRKCRQLPKAF